MQASRQSLFDDLHVRLLKARAQAKQVWLERMLSSPPASPAEALRRKRWIAQALQGVNRAQAGVKSRAGLLDAYTEHLSVLEMTLMGASEDKGAKPPAQGKTTSSKTS
jgi:hypothetical protein